MRLTLPAVAGLPQAGELLARLGPDVDEIDAAGLRDFDTATVALLLEAQRRAQARGAAGLRVLSPPPKLVRLARLYGVDALLGLGGPAEAGLVAAPAAPAASAHPDASACAAASVSRSGSGSASASASSRGSGT